jgi:hypothetical protein
MLGNSPRMFKAQLARQFIGIMLVIIIAVAVVIPVTNSVIATANLTGTTLTIVQLIPVLIAVAIIMVITNIF